MSSRTVLRADRVEFAFAGAESLLHDVSFELSPGWTGLVGANGSGKTTLLRVLRGELQPTSGHLHREGDVGWCRQDVEHVTESIRALAEATDGSARAWWGRLKLNPVELERWPTLSPGERKRWQLAAALWSAPSVLLLDEPSNHLDREGQQLLLSALRKWSGAGLIVSHDRALLDAVTHTTLRLRKGTVQRWALPYSQARKVWTAASASELERQTQTRQHLELEKRSLQARRQTLTSSTQQRSTGARMKSRSDGDARTLGAGFRAEQAQMAHAASLRRVARRAEDIEAELDSIEVEVEPGQRLFLRSEPAPWPTVVQWNGALEVDGTRVHDEVGLQVARGEHWWLRGRNGAGKSTLLRAALSVTPVPVERRLVLPQELSAEELAADLEHVRSLEPEERGRVLQLVHALGVEPSALLATDAPSPGEGRKLRLALGLGRDAWLAVLDEPTNHLDVPSIERLEVALREFPGALLLVTHDERLGEAVTTRRLELWG